MSKHYRINDDRIIDLEKYEMTLRGNAIEFNYLPDYTKNFRMKFESEQICRTVFGQICEFLIDKNEPLFYEVNDKIIINLREVKSINKYQDTKIGFTFFSGDQSEWSYDKTFDTPEAANAELKRIKELLCEGEEICQN